MGEAEPPVEPETAPDSPEPPTMNPLPPAGGVGPAAIAFSLIGLALFILVALSVCQSIR